MEQNPEDDKVESVGKEDVEVKEESGLRKIIIALAPALIVGLLLFMQMGNMVSKVSFQSALTDIGTLKTGQATLQATVASLTPLSGEISQLNNSVNAMQNTLNSVSSNIPTQVSTQVQSQIANLATKSDINSLINQLAQANASILATNTDLESKIKTLTDANTALVARVATLETKLPTIPSASTSMSGSPISVNLTVWDKDFVVGTSTNNTVNVTMKFTMTNTSTQDLTDVVYEIPVYIDAGGITSVGLTTDGVGSWNIKYTSNLHDLILRNTRLTLYASTKKTIYFTLTIQFSTPTDGSIECSASDIELISWDYK